MKRSLVILLMFALGLVVACTREDGLPDPPLQTLVAVDGGAD